MVSGNLVINKAFMTKTSCFKIMLNTAKECYMHWGLKQGDKYNWTKVKFSDMELGDMLLVLDGKKSSTAFFHKYNENTRQIWVLKKGDSAIFKVKEMTKTLNMAEQEVLKSVLKYIIVHMNLS